MAKRGTSYEMVGDDEGGSDGGSMAVPYGIVIGTMLLGTFMIAAVALGFGVAAWVQDDPTKCRDLPGQFNTHHKEVFVFGNSIDDMGNFFAYINGGAYSINGTGIIVPGTTEYPVSPAGPGKFAINYVNPMHRYGQGRNGMDFVAQKYLLHSGNSPYASHVLSRFDDLGGAFMVNFAIGGATANGNVANAPTLPLPHNWLQVVGPHGYDFQVNEFLTKLAASHEYTIKSNTWFFYNFVGANDMSLIANCSVPNDCIVPFIEVHLANLQALYDAGMRNLILTYADGGFEFNPTTIKFDPSGTLAAQLNGLASIIFNGFGFIFALEIQIAATMPELNLALIPLTDVITPVAVNPVPEGIRPTLAVDPSPLSSAVFPFPTFLDGNIVYNADYFNTFYYDDNHPTEAGSRWYAQTFTRYLDSQFNLCNNAPN